MIDIDELEKLCKYEINRGTANPYTVNENPIHAMQELITRLRQSEKDAARYRWLDEQNKSVMSKVMVCNGLIDDGDDVEYVRDIASFIDEAMQCK